MWTQFLCELRSKVFGASQNSVERCPRLSVFAGNTSYDDSLSLTWNSLVGTSKIYEYIPGSRIYGSIWGASGANLVSVKLRSEVFGAPLHNAERCPPTPILTKNPLYAVLVSLNESPLSVHLKEPLDLLSRIHVHACIPRQRTWFQWDFVRKLSELDYFWRKRVFRHHCIPRNYIYYPSLQKLPSKLYRRLSPNGLNGGNLFPGDPIAAILPRHIGAVRNHIVSWRFLFPTWYYSMSHCFSTIFVFDMVLSENCFLLI